MRHRVKKNALGRDTKHRKALFKNQLRSLFEHGAIETTEAKAKAVRRMADKILSKALPANLQARRTLERFFGSRQIVNRIIDSVVPAVNDRRSGFTTLTKLGKRRGDDASMVKLELVAKPIERATDKKEAKSAKKASKKTSKKADAPKKSAAKKTTKKASTKTTKAKKTTKKKSADKK